MRPLNVGLVYDLKDDYLSQGYSPEDVAEFDSMSTIEAIEQALLELGCVTEKIGNGRRLCSLLVEGRRWDLVFNIAEGVRFRSREAQVPCLLEMFEIPYTFSDPLVCAVTLDKGLSKRLVRDAGLHTAPFAVVKSIADIAAVDLAFPLFVKPIAEGTSKGIDRNARIEDRPALVSACERLLDRYDQPVLVEEYLSGREFTVGMVGTGPAARVIGAMEISIRDGASTQDYSFEVKKDWEQYAHYSLVEEEALLTEVEDLALRSYRALECRDGGRVDIRLDSAGRAAFIEINPLPGLNPVFSDLPILARLRGIPYSSLVESIVASASERIVRRERLHDVA